MKAKRKRKRDKIVKKVTSKLVSLSQLLEPEMRNILPNLVTMTIQLHFRDPGPFKGPFGKKKSLKVFFWSKGPFSVI